MRGAQGWIDSGLLVSCPAAAQPCAITLTARAESADRRHRGGDGTHTVVVSSTGPTSITAGTSRRLDLELDCGDLSQLRRLGRMPVQLVVQLVQAGTRSVWRGTPELRLPR